MEDRRYSLSVHYRLARNKTPAKRSILGVLAALRGARLVGGKDVVNVVPKAAPHKGTAAKRLASRFGAARVLYVGDDVTDEDAFALAGPRFIGIRVGPRRGSLASCHLKDQAEIADLLALLSAAALRAQDPDVAGSRQTYCLA